MRGRVRRRVQALRRCGVSSALGTSWWCLRCGGTPRITSSLPSAGRPSSPSIAPLTVASPPAMATSGGVWREGSRQPTLGQLMLPPHHPCPRQPPRRPSQAAPSQAIAVQPPRSPLRPRPSRPPRPPRPSRPPGPPRPPRGQAVPCRLWSRSRSCLRCTAARRMGYHLETTAVVGLARRLLRRPQPDPAATAP